MKVGDRVRTIDGKEGGIDAILESACAMSVDGRVLLYEIKDAGGFYLGWHLTPLSTPAISLEVERLQWAWGDEQGGLKVCNEAGSRNCRGCRMAEPHVCRVGELHCQDWLRCTPISAPSPWRKARIRWPNQSMVFSPGTVWPVEIQMEGE